MEKGKKKPEESVNPPTTAVTAATAPTKIKNIIKKAVDKDRKNRWRQPAPSTPYPAYAGYPAPQPPTPYPAYAGYTAMPPPPPYPVYAGYPAPQPPAPYPAYAGYPAPQPPTPYPAYAGYPPPPRHRRHRRRPRNRLSPIIFITNNIILYM
ncbi:hypothetical protein PUN28_000530 [Cardiocondyla obscurior]|uniref:Uncharacterized protein n=1 Tax=Cardiocondyla obscurior TaxID=286306 RepID=A0AAW2GZX2_9HYME